MALVVEAAENGQDFSMQAMRELRGIKKHFQPSTSASLAIAGSEEQNCYSSRVAHDDGRNHYGRERTAQKIRKATMGMTSTAPTYVCGRSQRYTRPASYWPELESKETKALEAPAPRSRENTLYVNGEEAPGRIKRATVAMTSTAPTHIHGRPEKAVPKARANLHGSVTPCLGTTSETETVSNTSPALVDSLSTGTPAEIDSEKTSVAAAPSTKSYEQATSEAMAYLNGHVLEKEINSCSSIFAGDSDGASSSPHCGEQPISGPSHNTSIESDGTEMPTFDRKPNAGAGQSRSYALSNTHATQTSNTRHLVIWASSRAEQAFGPEETPSATPQDHDEAKRNDTDSRDLLTTTEEAPSELTARIDDASFPPQPGHGIQLQHRHNTDISHPPNSMSWKHLKSLDESNLSDEQEEKCSSLDEAFEAEQQRVSQEDADVESEETRDEQHQAIQYWIPFPRRPQAPLRSTGQRSLKPDFASGHVVDTSVGEETTMHIMTEEEKAGLALRIQSVFSSDGLLEGQRAWKAAACQRLRANDLATVDFLYEKFVERGGMSMSPRHYVFRSLIQWHYERSEHSIRAAEMLFPDLEPSPDNSSEPAFGRPCSYLSLHKEGRFISLRAIRFLQGLWEMRAGTDGLLLNLRRVIMAAKLRGVKPVEELFAVVIRLFTSTGDMPNAQAVYDEMVSYHQIKASFLSLALLLRGYARISDWGRVEHEIESLHHCDLSRTRPHGYAIMINAILQEYAARASIEQFQNFLINAISRWGLVPTSSISITTIQAYMSQQRYDLVREWMETLQALFPQLETETVSFQWMLGDSWQRAGANCQDIEQAIKAVAYRNPRTRLKSFFLPTIHEALCRDLAAKLDAAQAKIEPNDQSFPSSSTKGDDFIATRSLDEYITSAISLVASTLSQNGQSIREVIDLHSQAIAAQRLNTFLTSTTSSEAVDRFSFPDPGSDSAETNANVKRGPVPVTSSLSYLQDSIPRVLTGEFLPETTTISRAILEFYHSRSMRDLPTNHVLFRRVCDKLLHADRAFDATLVIQKVYGDSLVRQLAGLGHEGSGHADGAGLQGRGAVAFGIQFYEFWMRLAWVTRSLVQWKRVVEEVLRLSRPGRTLSCRVEQGPEEKIILTGVKITSSFLFLTQYLASKVLNNRWSRWGHDDRSCPPAEVLWLVTELAKRRDEQLKEGREASQKA